MFQCVLSRIVTQRCAYFQQGITCRTFQADEMITKLFQQASQSHRRIHRSAMMLVAMTRKHNPVVSKRVLAKNLTLTTGELSVAGRLIEKWIYEVDPFGKLDINVPFDVEISTLNPQEYPEMNKALITILTKEDGQNDKARSFADIYNLKIDLCGDKKNLTVTTAMADGIVLPVICSIKLPLKFDVRVRNTQPCDVSIKKTECADIDVVLTRGDCLLKSVKSGRVAVECSNGNITSDSLLQGNITLRAAGKGYIKGKRFQGSTVECITDAGDLHIGAIYADKSHFFSCHGDVHLGSCHGNTDVKIDTGNLTVDTLNGDLTAAIDNGNIDVFIERHDKVDVSCGAGDISLKCRKDLESEMRVIADSLAVDDDIKFDHTTSSHKGQTKHEGFLTSQGGGEICAHTRKGAVRITCHNWLSSLGLKFD
ncbi:protein FAM185A-like [Haliotis cracherodii]|uniref:protein FAM185A-like n=1 Tax=Haliotis cracherodii TaxID=6455 RepID=UPI0039E82507